MVAGIILSVQTGNARRTDAGAAHDLAFLFDDLSQDTFMKITCLDKTVGQMLTEAYYKIPRFQRPYSWDHVNIEEFWTDVVVESESDYFIGNFVVYDDKGVFGVVDGQQRLTTITLLLCALRNAFQSQSEGNLAKGLHNLIERSDIKADKYYVLQTETSYPYFQEHIQKFKGKPEAGDEVAAEEKLLKQSFEYLRSKIDGIVSSVESQPNLSSARKKARIKDELSKVRDKVLSLKLIFTALDNDDDAYVIFETLNTRGKDLTLSDLVKSHLTRLLKPANKGVDITKDKWSEINELFEESQADLNISTFIHHHWLSRYEYTTEKKLYKAIRKKIKKDNAADFLTDLVVEASIYRSIHEPLYRAWKKEEYPVRDALMAMNLFRIKQQLPLVLSVIRQYDDGRLKLKPVRQILRAIENFHFAFTAVTSQRSSGGISFMYALTARSLYSAKSPEAKLAALNELHDKLADKNPSFAEFEAAFRDLKFSSVYTKQRALVRYILVKLYEANSPGLAVDGEKMTIEHLAPENPPAGSGIATEVVASIGNLILITQDINNKLGNKPFDQKRTVLSNSKVWIDAEVVNATKWGKDEIDSRMRFLAEEAYSKVWKLE
jgi:uncharacterized protein with ParB-like and HNH nuclease domain